MFNGIPKTFTYLQAGKTQHQREKDKTKYCSYNEMEKLIRLTIYANFKPVSNHAQQQQVKNSDGPLDNQTCQTVQLCE